MKDQLEKLIGEIANFGVTITPREQQILNRLTAIVHLDTPLDGSNLSTPFVDALKKAKAEGIKTGAQVTHETRQFPNSSSIKEATYNFVDSSLQVTFVGGAVWVYSKVLPYIWRNLKQQDERGYSVGRYFHQNIRDKFIQTRIS